MNKYRSMDIPVAITTHKSGSKEWLVLASKVKFLSWLSLLLMTAEGGIAITAGIIANSIALVGFGIDSAIEGFASVIIIWRFSKRHALSESAERKAQKLVAVQFFLLSPYVAYESLHSLATASHADPSLLGIGLSIASLISMPILGIKKQKLARKIDSRATMGEGAQNLLCAYLAAALLLGLLGNAFFSLWWLDPAVGFIISIVALKEGREAWRGEGCC